MEHNETFRPSEPDEGNCMKRPWQSCQRLFAASAVTETGSRKAHRELCLWSHGINGDAHKGED